MGFRRGLLRPAIPLILLAAAAGCASRPPAPPTAGPAPASLIGVASYYAHKFHGRRTASGETYDENQLTAAHRTLPFGTVVRVTNLGNGRSVTVRINDRGPWVKDRIIDLSYRAARELDFIRRGLTRVELEVISDRD
jgi:rare lipoprotein A